MDKKLPQLIAEYENSEKYYATCFDDVVYLHTTDTNTNTNIVIHVQKILAIISPKLIPNICKCMF